MIENQITSQSNSSLEKPVQSSPHGDQALNSAERMQADQKRTILVIAVVVILFLGLTIASILFLMNQPLGEVSRIRDIFIIFMAVQSLLTGLALVILMIQLARLINLLQNEIKPILDTTQDTVNNLRGTTVFLGENLVEPIMKLNEYLAGLTQLFSVIGLFKRSSHRNQSKGE